ncbi:16S rRNA (guanine(527)-N(7))-methyltransferase RsmG [Salipiger sp. P9]|uniref:16S rRNA (guanine(527)-N(7))-methyltransferase RsmG n=1 Tax=Salipiger pentaromativorans TaxID=2943193 RepID=UPI0021576814|nr:16S rRNA (guanine(527)-N(7))-methyltransferase RsmG [Salipiger pentaromativorans]MCR8549543.1 16S rRNA (guanine(527)-N(7))-methyltransferase RsmG [Salipiger pentaromativorans]
MTLIDPRLPELDVSRETLDRLTHFVDLLEKWSPKINLVSRNTLSESWSRHIVDSAQVFQIPDRRSGRWADLGAGGGFPGLVVAILAQELAPDLEVVLVESDQRKGVFLRSVLRETGVSARVLVGRIEEIDPLNADVLSARALADLSTLMGFADRHLATTGQGVFLKGANWKKELDAARESWKFRCAQRTSITDPNAVVLTIGALTHV